MYAIRSYYAHGLPILEDPSRALLAASGLLQAVDEHDLRERVGNLEPLDQVGDARLVVELDLAPTAIGLRQAVSQARKQAHLDPHRSIYAALPESSVSWWADRLRSAGSDGSYNFV